MNVEQAHSFLLRHGHIRPVVALSGPAGRHVEGPEHLPAEIGSVTKVFTGLLLAVLVADNAVRHDDRISGLLPSGTPLAPGVGDITLEDLASHRSGLPRLPPRMPIRGSLRDPYARCDARFLIRSLARTKLRASPYNYSNYGVGLLGYLLGVVTGLGYEESLHRCVLDPLALTDTSFADAPLRQGHTTRKPVPPWHFAAMAGAGGLHASAADLLTFLARVRDCDGPLADPIADSLRPRTRVGDVDVGLGWDLLSNGDIWHDGGTRGAATFAYIERSSGNCIVVFGDQRRYGLEDVCDMLLQPKAGQPR